jgi:hypothetical protein
MATTTNYSWSTPDDTDLVKDGAAAIRTLGSSIDTTTKNLNPSTTLGDIEYRSSTANTNTRLGIGSSGQVLTVAAGVPSWATPTSSAGMTLISTTTFTSVATQLIGNFSSTYTNYRLVMNLTASQAMNLQGRFSISGTPNTSSNYSYAVYGLNSSNASANLTSTSVSSFLFSEMRATEENLSVDIYKPFDATITNAVWQKFGFDQAYAPRYYNGGAMLDAATSYDQIQLLASTGTISGTVRLYGYSN